MSIDLGPVGQQPNFFGRDKVVPFIGYVENVNDKKHSNRVQIRIPGLHPYKKNGSEDESVKNEDLPWARCLMPTTMAQQGRIGGTIGMQPGAWVFGFFLDGEDSQDPLVVGTFNMTSRSSQQFNREIVDGDEDGENEQVQEGGTKIINNENWPNAGLLIYTEQSKQAGAEADKAADNSTGDYVDPCTEKDDILSKHSYRQMKEERKEGNEESQIYDVRKADGLCGTNKHGRDDAQSRMKEAIPSQMDRFTYGDAVWDKMTGSSIDLNSIFKQVAFELANMLKKPLETFKAETMEEKHREKMSQAHKQTKDRTGLMTLEKVTTY